VLISSLATASPGKYQLAVQATSSEGAADRDIDLTVNAAAQELFSQGSIQFSSSEGAKPAVAIQALDFYFGREGEGVLSVRATLPTASTTPASGDLHAAPNETLKSQVLDAFGGVLNFSGGWQKGGKGFNLDARGAIKLVEVPNAVDSASKDGYTQSPLVTAGVNVKRELEGTGTGGLKAKVVLVASYFFNAVPESDVAARFTTPLNRTSHTFNASVTLSVPDLHFYVVGQFRASNDPQIGHQFVFSLNPVK
jgi:hypothetical protein